jgi:hypothetical protein
MPEVVWVADWEMQCCGDRFAVGGEVAWRLSPVEDRPSLSDALGDGAAGTVTAFYDHHSDTPAPPEVKGVVRTIRAVFRDYQLIDRTLVPMPGSTVAVAREAGNGWEPEAQPQRFAGYLVELDTPP